MGSQRARQRAVLVCVLLGAMALTLFPSRRLRPRVAPPRTLAELTEIARHAQPPLHVIPATDFSQEAGLYLCTSRRSARELRRLCRSSQRASQWQGVVYCEPVHLELFIPDELLQDWGPNCMQIGPLLFFGDPALLARLQKMVLAPRAREDVRTNCERFVPQPRPVWPADRAPRNLEPPGISMTSIENPLAAH